MQINKKRIGIAVLSVLCILTTALLFSCSKKITDRDEGLKGLMPDSGETAADPLENTELSEDIIISIQRPDIMGGDSDQSDPSGDASTSEPELPVDEDEDMEDFEGSSSDSDADDSEEKGEDSSDEPVTEPSDTTEEPDGDDSSIFDPDIFEEDQFQGDEQSLYDVPLPVLKQMYVIETATEFGIPPELIFGVMYTESRYQETAISSNGKYIGIMQVAKSNLKTLTKKFGITDLQDFNQNVTAGAYFLSYFYKKYDGDIDKVLMCYHCGEGGAKTRWRNGITQDGYCRKVRKEIDRILDSFEPVDLSGKVAG